MKEPKLRFLADDGSSFPDLKEKRLNDVCEYNKGQSVGVNYVGTENMKQDFSGVNDLDSENEVKGVAYNIGDTLMSNIRPYLKKTWKADVNGVCSTDVLVFHPTDINSDYLYRNISSEKFISYVMTAAKGSKMPRGDKEHIMNYDIQVPCLSEQQKIAFLFAELDTLIQSAKKELEGYRELKQGMLQKMFPKMGEKVPEIRFPEFTGDWEQHRFSELVLIERGGSPRPISAFITKEASGLNWVKIGDAPTQGRFITKTAEKIKPEGLSKTREVHPGDLILSNSMSFGKPYIMGINGCIHDGWLLIRDVQKRFDLKFLCNMLSTEQMLGQYKSLAAGSAVNNLNKELVGNTIVTIPPIEEQRILGDYFENLDNLIVSQQQELDGYKELKKGLLQQMFC